MRKNGNLIALSVLLAVSSVASATASFAWFVDGNGIEISFGNTNDNHLTGAVEKSLFDSGSGIDEDPYIIKTPVQLYNLAWAYYSGKYDGQYPYFKVANDINMTGYTLPPIGTEDQFLMFIVIMVLQNLLLLRHLILMLLKWWVSLVRLVQLSQIQVIQTILVQQRP